jgi:hypothetical protein
MIRVTVELVPFGREEDKITLASGEIVNNLLGTKQYGSYNYIFNYKTANDKPVVSSGILRNHLRADNVLRLVKKVLEKIV